MSDDELRKVADIVMSHFNAGEHQAALVIHEKERSSKNGNRHAHLVLGQWVLMVRLLRQVLRKLN